MPGRPALYATTRQFLDYFNLASLEQLPPLSELQDMLLPEPQLELAAGTVTPVSAAEGDAVDAPAGNPSTEPAETPAP